MKVSDIRPALEWFNVRVTYQPVFVPSLSLNLLRSPISNLGDFTSSHLAPTTLTLDTRCHTDVGIPNETPEHVDPTVVSRERGVELVGDLAQLGQACPGHSGEVVVLVVITNIVGQDVERTVVTVRLGNGYLVFRIGCFGGHGLVHVVLGDEVACGRMEGSGQEGREEEVQEGIPRLQSGDENVVEEELDDKVEKMDPGEGHLEHAHGADGIEEDLKCAEEGLAQDGVEDDGLDGSGKVGVKSVNAK